MQMFISDKRKELEKEKEKNDALRLDRISKISKYIDKDK